MRTRLSDHAFEPPVIHRVQKQFSSPVAYGMHHLLIVVLQRGL
jgi:hypothetical protein